MGPNELRELDRRVQDLENRMNAYETWRAEIDKAVKAESKPSRKKSEKED